MTTAVPGIKMLSRARAISKSASTSDITALRQVQAYSTFLPNMAVDQLQADLGPEIPTLDGTTCEAAVMFTDASGFTALTEKLAQRPDGAELMCQIMNRFLGAIIDIVHTYCGDVVKFAGDAVSVIFPIVKDEALPSPRSAAGEQDTGRPRARDMRCAVARATACACKLHAELHNFEAYKEEGSEPICLALHIGVGCGEVTILHLGGHGNRWEFVLAGPPISQSADAEPQARSGETCLSPQVWEIIGDLSRAAPVTHPDEEHRGFMLIDLASCGEELAMMQPVCLLPDLSPSREPSLSPAAAAHLLPRLLRYVPTAVRAKLQQGVVSKLGRNLDLSEMRSVSVMFINCKGLQLAVGPDADCAVPMAAGQAVLGTVQEEVHSLEGQVNKMLVDDKGTVILAVFGLPPRRGRRPHSDDSLRALRVASTVTSLFDGSEQMGVKACVGPLV